MTREELIERLKSRGFFAEPRDWSMGETVHVAREVDYSLTSGDLKITALRGMTYVRLNPDDGWTMMQPDGSDLDLQGQSTIIDELVERLGDPFIRTST